MSFGNTPTTSTQSALLTNQFPLSSVAVPGAASGNLTALEGGPASTDSNGNQTAPASMYVKDGSDLAQGATTDAAVTTDVAATISAKLRGLVKISGDIWDSTNHRIRVDGSGVTQPISAVSLPLPAGAATSAKQPALGTAGSASSDVITVQGIVSMTPLKVDGSGFTQPISGSVSVSNFPGTQVVSGTVTANAGTGTFTNQQSNVQLDYDSGVGTQSMTLFGVALPASGGAVAGGTSSNPLRTDPTGTTTQPVSGTVNAAQSGTWSITNISGTVSLPSGAATSAKQPALGTAGVASSDVLTVQGIASMTALKVDGSGVTQPVSGTFWQTTQPISGTVTANVGATNGLALDASINGVLVSQGSTTSGQKGPLIQGAVTTSAPTYTTAQTSPISLTTAGAVRVDGSGVTQPISVASLPLPSGAATSAKQPALGTAGAASSDVLTVQGIASMTALKVDGSAVTQPVSGTFWQTTQPVSGTVTANAGTGTFNNQQSNVTTDYDTGVGTQTMTMFGMALPASGGSVAGGTATNPVRTDPTGTTTQPISATSLPLPTGAATSARQPALGTAGSASSDVLTVQGITSMTALKVDGSAVTQPVSGTFWQTTQPVSGTITANIGTTNGLALDTSVNGLLAAQGSTTSGQKGPLVQGAVTTSAPTYTTAQTSPISLTTAGAVRVDGSGVTQPVSGTFWQATQPVSAASLPLPSGAATSAKQPALGTAGTASSDVLTVQGIASMTALKVDGSAVTQPVSGTVTANAGTNLNTSALALETGGNLATLAGGVSSSKYQTNLAQISGSAVATAATGVQKVGIVGNGGATVDSTVAAGSAPTNAVVIGAVYNSSAPAPTSGQAMAVQADQAGNLRAFPGVALAALSAWNSSTALNATQNIFTNSGAASVLVQLTQTSTLTAGAVTFEVSYDGSTWNTIPASCVLDPTLATFAQISLPYTVQASTNKAFLLNMNGAQGLRVKLSTQISGTGTVTPNYALLPLSPADTVIALSPTAANFNVSAAQSGTWNITNVSGTVSLPTGAATSAKQPALGTAGTASSDVLTVQGIASMTALKVDGSAVTQPVSGTVNAAQSGTWTVQPGNTANTTAWKVDGSAVTQPVSGTVTANAGANLNTSALALDTSVNGVLVSQGSTTSGQKGPLVQGAVTTNAPSYTTAQTSPISLDTSGLLRASLKDTPSNTNNLNVNLAASAATVTVSGTVTANQGGSNWSQNLAQIGGTNVVTAGTSGLLAVGGPVASGASNADNPVKVGGAFNTTQPTVTTGQIVDAQMTARGAQIVATGADTFTVTANAGTNLNTSALALESGGNLATLAGAVTSAKVQANVAQINGVAPTMGNGVSGTGVQRVTIASDSTGQVALAAGANTIGAVTQASGPWTSNITQFGGNAVATGTGAGGTGIPRVTVSNDSQVQLWDGTNGPATIKAAATSSVIADKAQVAAISPNNTGLPVNLPTTVQKTSNVSSGSVASLAKAFASNNTAGNSIIVVCAVGNGTAPTISDTNSNVYTQATPLTANGTALNVAVFYSVGPASGGGIAAGANTVTVTNGGTTASIAMEIYEVSGLITQVQAQPDQTATNTGSSGTASTGVIAAASPNEWAFAGIGVGTAAQTIAVGSGWTNDSGQQNPTTPAGLFSFVSMSQFLGSLKAVTPQATFTSEPWAIAVASFRPVVLGVEGTMAPSAATSGGSTSSHTMSAASTNATSLKPSPGQLYGFSISNANAAARYFKIYNKASSPTVGTDTPIMTVQVPANGTVIRAFPVGLALGTGIAWAATGGITDADTTAIGANDLSVDIDYR